MVEDTVKHFVSILQKEITFADKKLLSKMGASFKRRIHSQIYDTIFMSDSFLGQIIEFSSKFLARFLNTWSIYSTHFFVLYFTTK